MFPFSRHLIVKLLPMLPGCPAMLQQMGWNQLPWVFRATPCL